MRRCQHNEASRLQTERLQSGDLTDRLALLQLAQNFVVYDRRNQHPVSSRLAVVNPLVALIRNGELLAARPLGDAARGETVQNDDHQPSRLMRNTPPF